MEDVSYEELYSNIKFYKDELANIRNRDKGERADYVVKLGSDITLIEVNNNSSQEVMERNIEYANRLYAENMKVGESYINYRQVI